MKNNIFKRRSPDAEPEDLDEGYNADYYGAAYRSDYGESSVRRAEPTAEPRLPHADEETVEQRSFARSVARPVAEPAPKPTPKKPTVKYFTPVDSNAGRRIVAQLVDGSIVVVNIKKLDRASFVRLFDYIMGAVQALDGEMNKIDRTSVVFAPHGTDISGFSPKNAAAYGDEESDESDEDREQNETEETDEEGFGQSDEFDEFDASEGRDEIEEETDDADGQEDEYGSYDEEDDYEEDDDYAEEYEEEYNRDSN